MRKDGFVVVQPWMVDYNLNGNKLLIYALIYGFSQDEQSCFYGSASYIMEYYHLSKNTVLNILAELEKDGLIRKWSEKVNGRPTNHYAALRPEASSSLNDGCKKCTSAEIAPVQKMDSDGCKNCTCTSAEIAPKKENNNKANNKLLARGCEETESADTPADVFINFANGNQALLQSLREFDEYRRQLAAKDKRKQWSALAARKICKSLVRLTKEAGVQNRIGYMIAMLDQSIESSWTGVFTVKDFVDRIPEAPRRAAEPDKPRIVTSETTLEELLRGAT